MKLALWLYATEEEREYVRAVMENALKEKIRYAKNNFGHRIHIYEGRTLQDKIKNAFPIPI